MSDQCGIALFIQMSRRAADVRTVRWSVIVQEFAGNMPLVLVYHRPEIEYLNWY